MDEKSVVVQTLDRWQRFGMLQPMFWLWEKMNRSDPGSEYGCISMAAGRDRAEAWLATDDVRSYRRLWANMPQEVAQALRAFAVESLDREFTFAYTDETIRVLSLSAATVSLGEREQGVGQRIVTYLPPYWDEGCDIPGCKHRPSENADLFDSTTGTFGLRAIVLTARGRDVLGNLGMELGLLCSLAPVVARQPVFTMIRINTYGSIRISCPVPPAPMEPCERLMRTIEANDICASEPATAKEVLRYLNFCLLPGYVRYAAANVIINSHA